MSETLASEDRRKLDSDDDARFYRQPRFVHHTDDAFRARLTDLYYERLPAGGSLLDLMSSHVSHLPADLEFDRVVGHGMNEAELRENLHLDDFFVRDLNREPDLPLDDRSFDAATIAVSTQYLQYPEAVFAELRRALRPNGIAIVSFSNRCFPTKAIRAWRDASMDGRADLVRRYFDAAGGFGENEVIRERSGNDPFCAVVARRVAGD